jgi:hypothetical protein
LHTLIFSKIGGMVVRYGYWIWSIIEIHGFADVESGDDITFLPIFDKKMSIAFQVDCKGIRSNVHNLL